MAGARPNFVKIAPLMRSMADRPGLHPLLVHTGQHYSNEMSDLFFKQLDIPDPDINLGVGSATHAVQTARIMERFEQVCMDERPDAVVVVGDVNSTAACVLVAAKMNIVTIHYEAGLRSFDRSMPEEINRVVTDAVCDYYFTTSANAGKNLVKEGKDREKIFMVGNLMIDSLIHNLQMVSNIDVEVVGNGGRKYKLSADLEKGGYGVVTFHRPSNVDQKEDLQALCESLGAISQKIPLVFPIHPRTLKNIGQFGLKDRLTAFPNLVFCEPLGYLEFLKLVCNSKFVLTDSGGIQEETTYLNIPCLTIRPNTERPVTIWEGSNKLIKVHEAVHEVDLILNGKGKRGTVPKHWDGKTAERIVKKLGEIFCG